MASPSVAQPSDAGPNTVRVRMRGAEFGGHPDGTPELYIADPDGIVVQLQDNTYCGGEGLLGELCNAPEPAAGRWPDHRSGRSIISPSSCSDQQRSIAFYQELFGMPITTVSGHRFRSFRSAPDNQFLALAQGSGRAAHSSRVSGDGELPARRSDGDPRVPWHPSATGGGRGSGRDRSSRTSRCGCRIGAARPTARRNSISRTRTAFCIQLQDVRYCGGGGYGSATICT